ncbi:MAG TPA: hypothetical protein VIQ05_18705 [Tardiphaga sp.]
MDKQSPAFERCNNRTRSHRWHAAPFAGSTENLARAENASLPMPEHNGVAKRAAMTAMTAMIQKASSN